MLTSQVKAVHCLSPRDIARMWAVFRAHYEDVRKDAFDRDLAEKDAIVVLRDEKGVIQGFSTFRVLEEDGPLGTAHFLYSGDTIIDQAHWGRNDFALTWIRHAGRLAASAPQGGLYWFLIVKGHRTYRYLPTFAFDFYPNWRAPTPAPIKEVIDRLGQMRFGADYDPSAGIVRFTAPHGRLRPDLAEIPEKDRRRPEAIFFTSANPGYTRGDELVCLCRLTAENLKPIARRAFLAGKDGRAEPEASFAATALLGEAR